MNSDKLPPHNTEAEEAVLGSLLIDPDAIAVIAPWLSPEDFYNDSTRWTYDVCLSMYEKSEAINQITVAESLFRRGRLEEIGGMAYLSHVVSILPTSIHLEHYAQIVHRLASMRRLISAAGQIAAMAYDADSDADSVLSKAEDILFKLRGNDGSRDFIHIRHILEHYFEETGSDDVVVEGHITGIASGFDRLDSLL
ncbi:MAG: DnaB-like helicase N-terminal domain-containing protein, partial [Chloroflexota bacterium]|nr:DnaB-like helicase N-terminal domain-containing protein [Chloroflexota bacterium]